MSVTKRHGIGGSLGDPRWREFSDVLAAAGAAAVGLIPAGGAGGRTRRRFHPGSLNSRPAACRAAALFLPAEPWRNMDRHQSRLHHSTQGLAAGAPYPSSASLRSCRESMMPRRKGPQHPPQPGGREVSGEKRPKFVSVAWGGGTAAPAQPVGYGSGPRTFQFHWVYRAWWAEGLILFLVSRVDNLLIDFDMVQFSLDPLTDTVIICCPPFFKAVQMYTS